MMNNYNNVEVNLLRKLLNNKIDVQLNTIPRNQWFAVYDKHKVHSSLLIKIDEDASIKPINDIDFYKPKNTEDLLVRISKLTCLYISKNTIYLKDIDINAKEFSLINGEFYLPRENVLNNSYKILSEENKQLLEEKLKALDALMNKHKEEVNKQCLNIQSIILEII